MKGRRDLKVVTDLSLPPLLLSGLSSPSPCLVSACLTCLRTCLQTQTPPHSSLEATDLANICLDLPGRASSAPPQGCQNLLFSEGWVVPHLVSLLYSSTTSQQITVMDILAACCNNTEQQNTLVAARLPQVL